MATKNPAPNPKLTNIKKTAINATPNSLIDQINNQGPVDTLGEIKYRYNNRGPVDASGEQDARNPNPVSGPNQVTDQKSENEKKIKPI